MIKAIKQKKKLYITAAITLMLIAISIKTSAILSLAAFILSAVAILFFSIDDALLLLFALMPFANIFKLSPSSTSLFTLLELFAVLCSLIKSKKINALVPISLIALLSYCLILSGTAENPLSIIKFIMGFLLIYFTTRHVDKTNLPHLAYLFAASTSTMLLLCQLPEYMNSVTPYLNDLNYLINSSGMASDTLRESGFLGDPNYCSVMIITALALLCVLYYYKSIGMEFWIFGAILAPLGFLTYSKSYFLCIAMLALILIVYVLLPKHKGWAVIALFGGIALIVIALSGKIEIFNTIIDRFSSKDLTTGRTDLNREYLSYITSNAKILFFGEGLTADRFVGTGNNVHNIYIELLYKLGIIGAILYVATLCIAMKKSNTEPRAPKTIMNFVPALFVVVMFAFLAGVLNYATPFYIIIAYTAFHYRTNSGATKQAEPKLPL